jgi:cytochrome c-type biogenesis protein CcmH/NrfG
MVFAAAGTVFGFVLGYMAASWDRGDAPRPVNPASIVASGVAGPPPSAGAPSAAVQPLDPNEIKALEALATREPANADARIQLGNLLMDHARYDEASRWYGEALKLRPDQPDVLVDLGACLVEGGKPAEGLAHFDRALLLNPAHQNAGFNRGVALLRLGRKAEAAAAWEDLLKRYPTEPRFQRLRSQIDELRADGGKPS